MNCLNFKCDIKVNDNTLGLDINDYLKVALRNNLKRRFLFVSPKLGKHLAVKPEEIEKLGEDLAEAYRKNHPGYEKLNPLVIGFAETATCLAHTFFDKLENARFFITSTRERIENLKKLDFKEEHSHAADQFLYNESLNELKEKKTEIDTIILADDEITTAKTAVNIIKELQKCYDVKNYTIVSVLNWLDEKRRQEIKEEAENMGCTIDFSYMFNGSFEFELNEESELKDKFLSAEEISKKEIPEAEINIIKLDFDRFYKYEKYNRYTGRFGLDKEQQQKLLNTIKKEGKKLVLKYKDAPVLALGIEEFMYIPVMLSKEINSRVYFHSTTRSPIIPIDRDEYPIREKFSFESLYNETVNFIYNLNLHEYKECFLFMETEKDEKKLNEFLNLLKIHGIRRINIVKC